MIYLWNILKNLNQIGIFERRICNTVLFAIVILCVLSLSCFPKFNFPGASLQCWSSKWLKFMSLLQSQFYTISHFCVSVAYSYCSDGTLATFCINQSTCICYTFLFPRFIFTLELTCWLSGLDTLSRFQPFLKRKTSCHPTKKYIHSP